jgi:hypothetical protein
VFSVFLRCCIGSLGGGDPDVPGQRGGLKASDSKHLTPNGVAKYPRKTEKSKASIIPQVRSRSLSSVSTILLLLVIELPVIEHALSPIASA